MTSSETSHTPEPEAGAPTFSVRALVATDHPAWEPLWRGYQEFYRTAIPADVSALTWSRFLDPHEPMRAYGAFDGARLVGIVHTIQHRSCWTAGDYVYLQDLFTAEDVRGRGVGRRLIEHVYAEARACGASRVHWLTHETNTNAMLLYDRIADRSGFVQYRHVL